MQSPFCVTDLVGMYGALNCDALHLSWTTNMILKFRSHQYYVMTMDPNVVFFKLYSYDSYFHFSLEGFDRLNKLYTVLVLLNL